VTLMTVLVTRSMWGRAMACVRDSEVMAAAIGITSYRVKLVVFTFSGITAGLAGALFGSLQTYVTPDTFAFDLSLFFFICIIIGGKGSIIGPFIGTVVLTLLPELVAPLAKYSHLFYGVLLLLVILLVPGGLGQLFGQPFDSVRRRPATDAARTGGPKRPERRLAVAEAAQGRLEVVGLGRSFGAVKALDDVTLTVPRGTVHGLIGPNGSGKTTLLNMVTGYYAPDAGRIVLDGQDISKQPVSRRPALGIGRTFQTPRVVQQLSVLDNVVAGGWSVARASFPEALVSAPRSVADDRRLRDRALHLLEPLGLLPLANRIANALTHAELRFLEIARALMPGPGFLLLDEPASGLTGSEIERLSHVIDRLRREGMGVLLVEHHTDLVFGLSDAVTTLHLGRVICSGTPAAVRADPQVRRVYLGS
jgi:ABC-type branched-subunit amino acid transport system ATPase component